MKSLQHPPQPATGDDGVIIEQQHLPAGCGLNALVGPRRETTILLVSDDENGDWLRVLPVPVPVFVSPELDLIDVAVRISHDDKERIASWMADGKIGKVTDEQAQAWAEGEALLWTSVVHPFILVQQEKKKLN